MPKMTKANQIKELQRQLDNATRIECSLREDQHQSVKRYNELDAKLKRYEEALEKMEQTHLKTIENQKTLNEHVVTYMQDLFANQKTLELLSVISKHNMQIEVLRIMGVAYTAFQKLDPRSKWREMGSMKYVMKYVNPPNGEPTTVGWEDPPVVAATFNRKGA